MENSALTTLTKARQAVDKLRDFAREHGMHFRQRDPLVLDIHDALDAFEEQSNTGRAQARDTRDADAKIRECQLDILSCAHTDEMAGWTARQIARVLVRRG